MHAGVAYLPNVSAGHDVSGAPGQVGGHGHPGRSAEDGQRATPGGGHAREGIRQGAQEGRHTQGTGASDEPRAETTTLVVCTTTNVGFDRYGLAHPRGGGAGTALRQCLDEAEAVGAHIVAVQEHKLGKHDHSFIPELKGSDEWEWLGFPGDKRGRRGLGFFLRKGVVVQGSKAVSLGEGEVAALLALVHMIKIGAVNTYWSGKVSDESLTIMLEHVRMSVEDLIDQGAQVVLLMGDLNVNMLAGTPCARRLTTEMRDMLGMRRVDMEGDGSTWVTHIRGASHLDCLAIRASCVHEVKRTWNRNWARVRAGTRDSCDHTSLGLELSVTAVPEHAEEQEWQNVAHPVKYKYKLATEEQKGKYGEAFESTIDAGIQDLADALSRTTLTESRDAREQREEVRAEAQVVTCLITAAAHRAATRTMKQHKMRNEPCKRPKKKVSVVTARRQHAEQGEFMWEKISSLRSTGKNATASRSSVPSVQVKVSGVTTTLYGIRDVQRELKRHAQAVSELNLHDDKFDAEYAHLVEAGVKLIRHDMLGAAGARTERDAPAAASAHGLSTKAEDQVMLIAMSWE